MKEILHNFILNHPHWVKKMDDTKHSFDETILNPFHIEDSVWTHTMMVCKEMERVLDEEDVDEDDTIELSWSALLHDIGKPDTWYKSNERNMVTFKGHENLGAFLAIDVLLKNNIPEKNILNIFKLIALHSYLQKHTVQKVESLFKQQGHLIRNLSFLHNSDNMGRFSIRESKVLQGDYHISNKPVFKQNCSGNKIVVMMGAPLSGKTTYLKKITNKDDIIISRHNILKELFIDYKVLIKKPRLEDYQNQQIKEAYRVKINHAILNGKNIYVDDCNFAKNERDLYLTFPELNTYHKECIFLVSGLNTLFERNKKKKRLPNFIIEKKCKKLNLPMYEDFDTIEYILQKETNV